MAFRLYSGQHKKHNEWDYITPNVEKSEGIRPWISTTVAPWLPLVRYNEYDRDYFVVSTGKVIAFSSNGFLIPAGLALDIEAGLGNGEIAYTQTDEDEGVLDAEGNAVTNGDLVADAMINAGITVSKPVGVTPYSYYRASGDGLQAHSVWDPTGLRYHNYQKQAKVAIVCDYVCEYPIVTTYAPAFAGIAAAVGTFTVGGFVTFDVNSNIIPANCSTALYCDLVGQVLRVDTTYPKAYLDRVKSRFSLTTTGWNDLDKMPGTATAGYPHGMSYADTTVGTLLVNLIRF